MSQPSLRSLLALGLLLAFAAGCGDAAPVEKPSPVKPAPPAAKCPVCGDPIAAERAVPAVVGGATSITCSNGCAARLKASPEKFGSK